MGYICIISSTHEILHSLTCIYIRFTPYPVWGFLGLLPTSPDLAAFEKGALASRQAKSILEPSGRQADEAHAL